MKKKNVIMICLDDLRPELGCYGAKHVVSPNIDKLAESGVVFHKHYCQVAVCNPSRSSMLTSLRPDTLSVWGLYEHFRKLNNDVVTIPQYFKENGYHSCSIGKIFHNDLPDPISWSEPTLHIKGYPYDPDAVYRDVDNLEYLEFRKKQITNDGNAHKYIDEYGEWYLKASSTENIDVPDEAYYDGAQTLVAIDKITELSQKKQPFFFGIGYYRPHLPFNAPKKYWDLYEREKIDLAEFGTPPIGAPKMALNNMRELRGYNDFSTVKHPNDGQLNPEQAKLLRHGYFASVSYVDQQIGKLLDHLKKLNIYDDSVIILWGDNGWKLGDYGSWGKMTNYEQDTRVPLIIKPPYQQNLTSDRFQLVESVDIFPTVCELAGLSIPQKIVGKSLLPIIKNQNHQWSDCAYSQIFRYGIWGAPDNKQYMGYTLRTENWRIVLWFDRESKSPVASELYDLKKDSIEKVNLSGNPHYHEVEQSLQTTLNQYISFNWYSSKL